MSKPLTFTRRENLDGLAGNKSVERELKAAHKFFARGEPVAESVWVIANALLSERARELVFNTRRSYMECQHEVLRKYPYLRLGVTAFTRDKYFTNVQFSTQDSTNEDAA